MSDNKFDPEMIRQLAKLLDETNLNEIEYKVGDIKIKVGRQNNEPQFITTSSPNLALSEKNHSSKSSKDVFFEAIGSIKSPMVGNVYLSPEPGSPAFIKEGDLVKKDQTLLIIEAMKVMNTIKAPKDGVIKKILVENSDPVEFDEVLIIID